MLLSSATSYRLLVFGNGHKVLEDSETLLASNPVLFLLDYQLPAMTGLDLYHQLHQMAGLEFVLALILTCYDLPRVVEEISRYGLPYLMKPFDIDQLLEVVNALSQQMNDE